MEPLLKIENLTVEYHTNQEIVHAVTDVNLEIKKGESNLPNNKDSGEKTLNVSSNNGDVNIEFVSKQ